MRNFLIILLCASDLFAQANYSIKSYSRNGRKTPISFKIGGVSIVLDTKNVTHSKQVLQLKGTDEKICMPAYNLAWLRVINTIKSIKDAIGNIKRNDKESSNFLTVVYIIQRMTKIKIESKNGWASYDTAYKDNFKWLDWLMRNPTSTVYTFTCYIDMVMKKIKRVSALMENCWVRYVCDNRPSACNPTLYAIIKMSNLDDEAGYLLAFKTIPKKHVIKIVNMIKEATADPVKYFEKSKEKLKLYVGINERFWNKSYFPEGDHCIEADKIYDGEELISIDYKK